MRPSVRSLTLIAAGYVVLVAGFAVAVNRWLHDLEGAATLETSRLLAREQAALLSERTLGALAAPDGHSRALLRERIDDLTMLSEVVSFITVVDGSGKVVASDRQTPEVTAATPERVFTEGWHPQLLASDGPRFLQGGDFAVAVPFIEDGRLIGYVEVGFHSDRVARLFGTARRHLLLVAVAGLVGVLALAILLQVEVSRRAASIVETLEDAVPAPAGSSSSAEGDEFTRMLQAAGRVRQALSAARLETSRLQESLGALAHTMRMGVLLLRRGQGPHFANARALDLFGVHSIEQLSTRWPAIRGPIDAALALAERGPEPTRAVRVDMPGPGAPTLRVEVYRLGVQEHEEYLVLLNDPEILDALETDVRLASQLHGLAHVYRTVAHELRAPLSAMMLHLELLRENLAGGAGDTTENQHYVVVLREELERLNRSLSEALTQTLPPANQRDRFDLREALAELRELLAPQARRQGVDLQFRVPNAPVVLVGFRDRLKQGFLNIAVNALEALPGGGQMSIEMESTGSYVTTRISDTGRGIPAAVLARIYERDFTTKGNGSGIGLYVARTLVEMHGGEIHVESAEGRGTRVEARLPILQRD